MTTSATLLARALELLRHAEAIEARAAPDTGLHTITPRRYQLRAAIAAAEQAERFPSAGEG